MDSDIEEHIRRLVCDTVAPGKHSARSALRHIDRAASIRVIDPAMCEFRLITAEEEAVTAVFHALRRRR